MRYRNITVLIIVSIGALCCSKPDKDDTIVAKFGTNQITLGEFRIGYLEVLKQPATRDSYQAREIFLNSLIDNRLLAIQAKKLGLDQDEKIQYRLNAYQNKCLREAHYKHVIAPLIKYDEMDVREAYRFSREQRRIKHLVFYNKVRADSAYRLLKENPEWFEKLARIVFKDTSLANSGGDLGWIHWDQMEYDMGQAAFRMSLDQISEPIRTSFGYHIIKVVDYKKDPLVSEQEYRYQGDHTRNYLEMKLGEKIAHEYLDTMMADVVIKLEPEAMKIIGEQLRLVLKRHPSQQDAMTDLQLKDNEVKLLEKSLWDRRHEQAVYINDRTITIGEFLANLAYVPYSALYTNFRSAVNLVLRDFQLTFEARQMGFDKILKPAKRKYTLFEDYLLSRSMRRKIIAEIKITEEEIENKYQTLQSKGKVGDSFETNREFIHKLVARERWMTEVPNYLVFEKSTLDVQIYPEIIHNYYDGL